jgi:arsenite methyltransferase
MLKKWLEYLADPDGKQRLSLDVTQSEGEEIIEGTLLNETTGRRFPIIGGIPRFVPPELYDEALPARSADTQTGRSFGDLWRTDTNRNLGIADAEYESMEEQFLAMLGLSSREELTETFRDGMNCLNAGCGVGWSEYLFDVNSKANRFDVDLSLAVESAYRNTRDKAHVMVVQADLLALPFAHDFFDVIFSNGVLHHTRSAPEAFDRLCDHLKPGGLVGIYVYNVKPFIRELADREIRNKTTSMSFDECNEFSKPLVELGKSFKSYDEQLEITADIPLLGIKKGKYDLQKFVYDHFVKCFYNEELGEEYSALVNVDWYHPQNASHHTRDEVIDWFTKNEIEGVRFTDVEGWEHSGFFVSGRKENVA